MKNLCISILYLLITFSATVVLYKKYKKMGLYCWICILVIISNIQTIKIVDLFDFTMSLGNISYGAIFLTTDILSEKFGRKSASEATNLSFIFMILFTLIMVMFLQYEPSNTDFSQSAFETIFGFIPRITVGSLIAYFCSQKLDAFLYALLKKKYNKVWISNNFSTFISQILDTFFFVSIAFLGTMSIDELITLIFTMLVFKWIIALLDTPFMLFIAHMDDTGMEEKDENLFIK
mgnify:FL=1